MQRRNFIKTTALGSLAFSVGFNLPTAKTHILSLSFDDGFKKSFYKIADIHKKYGLKAGLNIIASAHLKSLGKFDSYHNSPVGDFNDWNILKKRGHEIMPHTWDHQDLTKMQIDEAKVNIDKCVDYFNSNLDGFVASESVYNFAYNASTPELLDYVLSIFRAARTGGWDLPGNKKSNPFPHSGKPRCLGCWSFGPDNADDWVDKEVNEFLSGPGGWLILNLHGLDEEGWGPIQSSFLQVLLDKLVKIDYLDILPVGMALKKYAF